MKDKAQSLVISVSMLAMFLAPLVAYFCDEGQKTHLHCFELIGNLQHLLCR